MHTTIIEAARLSKQYADFKAVDNLTLQIEKGEIFGLLGPNGAGKTTTILMLMGLTEPTAGNIRICGLDPVRNPIAVKRKVGYLPEDVGFYDDLTGLENLRYTANLNGISRKEAEIKIHQLIRDVGLLEHADKKTGKYSRGMRQRLGLADVLLKDPEVIILDEPTLGIDPAGIKEFLELIVRLSKEEQITVLFSSHHLHQVQQVCDRVGIFIKGKLLAAENIRTLANTLFDSHTSTIEANIQLPDSVDADAIIRETTESLSQIHDILHVKYGDNRFTIACRTDKSAEIARIIVQTGLNLCSLQKKEYGLNDIYYRYFEGGIKDEE